MSFQIETHYQLNDQLLAEWRQLWNVSGCAHFFNDPSWFLVCRQVFPSKTYQVITVKDGRKLVAVLPLVKQRRFGIKTLGCPGSKHLSKSALLLKDSNPDLLSELSGHLTAINSFYLLEVDAEVARNFSQSGQGIVLFGSSVNPYFSLTGELSAKFSKDRQKQIFRYLRKYQNRFFCRHFRGGREGLDLAFAIDLKSPKRKKGMATFVTELDRQFFRQLAREFKERLLISVLFFDSYSIAFEIGFTYKNTYHVCNSGYDEAYGYLSPGRILLYYLFNHLRQENFRLFDFSRGNNSLKQQYTSLYYKQCHLYYAQNSLKKFWWKIGNSIYEWLLNNEKLYHIYLIFKRMFLTATDKLDRFIPHYPNWPK